MPTTTTPPGLTTWQWTTTLINLHFHRYYLLNRISPQQLTSEGRLSINHILIWHFKGKRWTPSTHGQRAVRRTMRWFIPRPLRSPPFSSYRQWPVVILSWEDRIILLMKTPFLAIYLCVDEKVASFSLSLSPNLSVACQTGQMATDAATLNPLPCFPHFVKTDKVFRAPTLRPLSYKKKRSRSSPSHFKSTTTTTTNKKNPWQTQSISLKENVNLWHLRSSERSQLIRLECFRRPEELTTQNLASRPFVHPTRISQRAHA